MKFKTAITQIKEGKEFVRGTALETLAREHTFTEAIFLILKGVLPNDAERKMFDTILVSAIDHGAGTASAMNARISASAKNPLHASVAAGILGFGDRHGTVIEQAMKFFYANKGNEDLAYLLKEMKAKKEYVMGYGHKTFKDKDSRTGSLFFVAKETDIYGEHCAFAERVKEELQTISSNPLPLNTDGAIAAILCDMGFDERVGNGIFVISRVPGLVAHIVEERANDEGIRRMPESEIEYI